MPENENFGDGFEPFEECLVTSQDVLRRLECFGQEIVNQLKASCHTNISTLIGEARAKVGCSAIPSMAKYNVGGDVRSRSMDMENPIVSNVVKTLKGGGVVEVKK